jgi:membrane protein
MGAALAYYTIFSLAPLLIIAIAIAGLAFGMQAAQGEITRQIQGLIGPEGAHAIQAMLQSAHKPAHGAIAGAIGVLVLFLGASGVLSEMQDALNTIWRVSPDDTSGVSKLIKARFLSFGMVLGIGFLLLVSLLLSAVLAAVAKYVNGILPVPAVLLESLDFIFSLFFITVLFAMIFKLLPSSLLKFPVHLRQTLHFGFMGHDAEVIGIDFDPLQLARFETLLMLGPLGFAIGRGCRRLP